MRSAFKESLASASILQTSASQQSAMQHVPVMAMAGTMSFEEGIWDAVCDWDRAVDQMHGPAFSAFVHQLLEMPRFDRKHISYDGAMRSLPSEPRHWCDPHTADWYWDATNLVYSRAFHSALLWGPAAHAWSLSQLNNESAGDIIEICLALAFRHDAYHEFRDRVEEMVRCTIAVMERLPELEGSGLPPGRTQWTTHASVTGAQDGA